MNNKLKHFKMSRYKPHRKPINKKAVAIVAFALLCFGASIGLGKYLDTVASDVISPNGSDTVDNTGIFTPYDDYDKIAVGKIEAGALESSAYLSDENADRAILKLNGSLKSAVSIRLLDEKGAPTYHSDVYERAYSADSGEMSLALFMKKAEQSGISVCAIFDMSSYSEEFADVGALRRGYELSMIGEAYSLGVRDMILCGIEQRDTAALYELVLSIKSSAPDLALGFAADYTELCSDSMLCARLDDMFDYLVYDLSDVFSIRDAEPDTDTESEQDLVSATDKISKAISMMQRFSSRALVRIDEEQSATDIIALFSECKIDSYVIGTK